MGNYFSSVMSKDIAPSEHPSEDRVFSVRELLHLMGMPRIFELQKLKKYLNNLYQNALFYTAAN